MLTVKWTVTFINKHQDKWIPVVTTDKVPLQENEKVVNIVKQGYHSTGTYNLAQGLLLAREGTSFQPALSLLGGVGEKNILACLSSLG